MSKDVCVKYLFKVYIQFTLKILVAHGSLDLCPISYS